MNRSNDTHRRIFSGRSEGGGGRLNFLIFMFVLAVIAYVGSQYIPVAYRASLLKVYMQDTVDKASATGKSPEWVEQQLRANADDYNMPSDAFIRVQQRDGRLEAQVKWLRLIPLPGYVYQYNFDHTVKSTTLFSTQ